ncbi:MAG: hypothetical protein ACKVOQ_16650 [Cyclobacteriaceae bacterium]
MFGLFKPKEPSVKVNDKIWITLLAKQEVCRQMLQANDGCLFVAWFEESFHQFQSALSLPENSVHLMLAQNATKSNIAHRMLIFVEHYPLRKMEQHLFLQLNLQEAVVLSSLDEAFFEKFGGEKLTEVMKRMGMKDNEEVSHSMITKSIQRAQEKIAETISTNRKAVSQREWFLLNQTKEPNAYKR